VVPCKYFDKYGMMMSNGMMICRRAACYVWVLRLVLCPGPVSRILRLFHDLPLGCVHPLAVNNVERFAIDAARINIYISAG